MTAGLLAVQSHPTSASSALMALPSGPRVSSSRAVNCAPTSLNRPLAFLQKGQPDLQRCSVQGKKEGLTQHAGVWAGWGGLGWSLSKWMVLQVQANCRRPAEMQCAGQPGGSQSSGRMWVRECKQTSNHTTTTLPPHIPFPFSTPTPDAYPYPAPPTLTHTLICSSRGPPLHSHILPRNHYFSHNTPHSRLPPPLAPRISVA